MAKLFGEMEINNLQLIKPLLNFANDDVFYHLQILKRKKEHPSLGSNSYVVKTYYISSIEYLEFKMSEIIELCKFHQARAYINLIPRSFEKIAFHTLKKVTDCIMNKDYKSVRKAYESICGKYGHGDKINKKRKMLKKNVSKNGRTTIYIKKSKIISLFKYAID